MTDDSILEQVAGLEDHKLQLDAQRQAYADQDSQLRAEEKAVQQALAALRERVRNGESTGDDVLDMLVKLTDSFERNTAYHRLKMLKERVLEHRGELLMVSLSTHPSEMGLLAEDANLQVVAAPIFGTDRQGQVIFPLSVKCQDRTRVEADSFEVYSSRALNAEVEKPLVERQDTWSTAFIAIGDAEVQAWMNSLTPEQALNIWAAATVLGRPLEASPPLAALIQQRREDGVAQLCHAVAELAQLTRRLKRLQTTPGEAFSKQHGYRVTHRESGLGVVLDFGLGEPISRARGELEKVLKLAAWLGMEDNPTFQTARRQFLDCPTE